MYIWLKTGGEERVVQMKKEGVLGENIRVEVSRDSGKKYINLYSDPMDPAGDIPEIPQDIITRITFKERIYRGFRPEGVYVQDDARLTAKFSVHISVSMSMEGDTREEWQDISVSALSLEALRKIYTTFRQGKLQPMESWE